MKTCPFCAEEIQDAAIVCRYCGRDLPDEKMESEYSPAPAAPAATPRKQRGYIAQNLSRGEHLIWETRLHRIIFWGPAILIVFGLGAGIAIASLDSEAVCGVISLLLALYGILALCAAIITRQTSEFAVTDRRVLIKTGFIRRKSLELLLAQIEGIGVNQGILGRMFGYGTITVTGSGGTKETFPNIANPLEFREKVQNQVHTTGTRSHRTDAGL